MTLDDVLSPMDRALANLKFAKQNDAIAKTELAISTNILLKLQLFDNNGEIQEIVKLQQQINKDKEILQILRDMYRP